MLDSKIEFHKMNNGWKFEIFYNGSLWKEQEGFPRFDDCRERAYKEFETLTQYID
jgi:hypothetical protein